MQRTSLVPSGLIAGPRPCETEIRIKSPQLRHNERPHGGEQHG